MIEIICLFVCNVVCFVNSYCQSISMIEAEHDAVRSHSDSLQGCWIIPTPSTRMRQLAENCREITQQR
jgi:hypothetical protein